MFNEFKETSRTFKIECSRWEQKLFNIKRDSLWAIVFFQAFLFFISFSFPYILLFLWKVKKISIFHFTSRDLIIFFAFPSLQFSNEKMVRTVDRLFSISSVKWSTETCFAFNEPKQVSEVSVAYPYKSVEMLYHIIIPIDISWLYRNHESGFYRLTALTAWHKAFLDLRNYH